MEERKTEQRWGDYQATEKMTDETHVSTAMHLFPAEAGKSGVHVIAYAGCPGARRPLL